MTHLHSERSQVVEYFLFQEDVKFPLAAARNRSLVSRQIKDYTPLQFFVDANNLRLVKCIVENYGAGEDINVGSRDGSYPFLTAIKRGNLEMIKYLLENCEPYISVHCLFNF
jgi:ankyrin repeat protein